MTGVGTAGPAWSTACLEDPTTGLTGRLAQLASLTGCPSVSVTEGRTGRRRVVAATDETARRDERLQHELGEGPGLQALRTGHSVLVQDVRRETRWPRWCDRSRRELGLRAVLAIPLCSGGRPLAVLSLCSRGDLPPDLDLALVHRAAGSVLTSLLRVQLAVS